jgi:hypothetical protein
MLPAALDLDPWAIPISQIPAALSALAAFQSALAARLMIPEPAAPASDVDKRHFPDCSRLRPAPAPKHEMGLPAQRNSTVRPDRARGCSRRIS